MARQQTNRVALAKQRAPCKWATKKPLAHRHYSCLYRFMKKQIETALLQIKKLETFALGLTAGAQPRLKEEIENLKLDVAMMRASNRSLICQLLA